MDEPAHKILVFTDLHVTPEDETIIGLDPGARLAEGLAHAARLHPEADRVILTGDLTHRGRPEEYDRLARILDGLPWPVTPMLGNHDRRAPFRARFPQASVDAAGFVQCVIDLKAARLICLDTLDEGGVPENSGWLCPARLDWLETALAGAAGRQTIVFVHHPPFRTGFTGMDEIGLRNRAALRARLARHGSVRLVVSGHIHRTIMAEADGMAMVTFKSPCHQMPMLLNQAGTGHSVAEPGAYGLLLISGDRVVAHSEDFTLGPLDMGDHG